MDFIYLILLLLLHLTKDFIIDSNESEKFDYPHHLNRCLIELKLQITPPMNCHSDCSLFPLLMNYCDSVVFVDFQIVR